jgi:hypothetical protein
MKTILIMSSLLIIALVAFVYHQYNDRQLSITEISVLRDLTDKHLSQPNANELIALYGVLGSGKWNGGTFRFSNVTDVSYNQIKEVSLEPANELFANEFTRDKQVGLFKDSITRIVTEAGNDSVGKEYSSIYLPVANELIHLAESSASQKILVIYSDLMENDLDVSLYAKEQLQLLETNSETLKGRFKKQKLLPSLAGIEVHITFQPKDKEDDKEFQIVSGFYKNMLEEKGANVFISANLTN